MTSPPQTSTTSDSVGRHSPAVGVFSLVCGHWRDGSKPSDRLLPFLPISGSCRCKHFPFGWQNLHATITCRRWVRKRSPQLRPPKDVCAFGKAMTGRTFARLVQHSASGTAQSLVRSDLSTELQPRMTAGMRRIPGHRALTPKFRAPGRTRTCATGSGGQSELSPASLWRAPVPLSWTFGPGGALGSAQLAPVDRQH